MHTSKYTENMNEINQRWIIYKKFDKFEDINTKHSWILRIKKMQIFFEDI